MKYQILTASSVKRLTEIVTEHLTQGWTLQGGVAVAHGFYCQTVVLEEQIQKEVKTSGISPKGKTSRAS